MNEECKKEIQSLRRKAPNLKIAIICLIFSFLTISYIQLRDYSIIQAYYRETQKEVQALTETIGDLILKIQVHQP